MAVPWWLILGGPLLSAVVGAFLSGYVVNRWKGREDQIEKRFDELCESVLDTAVLAAEYWEGTAQDAGMRLREAKILSSLRRIAGLRVLLSDFVSASAQREMEVSESAFIREVSGGQFGVHNRTADVQRIMGCHFIATELILTARRARLRDLRGLWMRG
jgi:hypothetical protein